MIKVESLRDTKIWALLLSALFFSIIYLIFVSHTFAQRPTSNARGLNQACQAHERSIKTRLDSLIKLVTNQETKFSSISARTENYYTTKLVPQGKILSNYNSLLADISAKKAIVDSDILTAKNDAADFSCTLPNPKSKLTAFRKDMQMVKAALKNYRTSIKNLIVAVRGIRPSPSPEGASK